MPSVEIVSVGTELLLGQLVDTNSVAISQRLADAGIDVYAKWTVGDNRDRIAVALREGLARAQGVVVTGGLGPTVDDLTKEAVCDVLGVGTFMHEPSLQAIEAVYERLGREMRENNRKQAEVPVGALVLENKLGMAPGFVAQRGDGRFIACMPGVPREMLPILDEALVPWLREHFGVRSAIYTRVLHTVSIAESEIDHRIGDLFRTLENPKIAVLAHDFRADVKIMVKTGSTEEAQRLIAPVEAELSARLFGHVYGTDAQTLSGAVHALLLERNATLAIAESCTGGAISAELTATPGSSKSFVGAIVAYDNAVKLQQLGVRAATLERFGAVSKETVSEMAQGVRAALGASYGFATTGIAGPSGGTPEKPVGLVWFATADKANTNPRRMHFPGDRAAVQRRATVAALALLWQTLRSEELPTAAST